jgi:hypothetical protein
VSGSNLCGVANVSSCTTEINYLTFDFLGRYLFSMGTFRPWLGGGVSLLYPFSKDSNALSSESIAVTNVITLAGGADFVLSPRMHIPVMLDYSLFPKSDEVEASWLAFRVGIAVPF